MPFYEIKLETHKKWNIFPTFEKRIDLLDAVMVKSSSVLLTVAHDAWFMGRDFLIFCTDRYVWSTGNKIGSRCIWYPLRKLFKTRGRKCPHMMMCDFCNSLTNHKSCLSIEKNGKSHRVCVFWEIPLGVRTVCVFWNPQQSVVFWPTGYVLQRTSTWIFRVTSTYQ